MGMAVQSDHGVPRLGRRSRRRPWRSCSRSPTRRGSERHHYVARAAPTCVIGESAIRATDPQGAPRVAVPRRAVRVSRSTVTADRRGRLIHLGDRRRCDRTTHEIVLETAISARIRAGHRRGPGRTRFAVPAPDPSRARSRIHRQAMRLWRRGVAFVPTSVETRDAMSGRRPSVGARRLLGRGDRSRAAHCSARSCAVGLAVVSIACCDGSTTTDSCLSSRSLAAAHDDGLRRAPDDPTPRSKPRVTVHDLRAYSAVAVEGSIGLGRGFHRGLVVESTIRSPWCGC